MPRALLHLFVGVVLLIGTTAFIWPQLTLFLASDSCMGVGGSFDFLRSRCDFKQTHPYVTFDLWPFWAAFGGVFAGIALVGRGLLGLRPGNSKPTALRGTA